MLEDLTLERGDAVLNLVDTLLNCLEVGRFFDRLPVRSVLLRAHVRKIEASLARVNSPGNIP